MKSKQKVHYLNFDLQMCLFVAFAFGYIAQHPTSFCLITFVGFFVFWLTSQYLHLRFTFIMIFD